MNNENNTSEQAAAEKARFYTEASMIDNSTTNSAAQPDEAASDRTPIYNAVAKLRDAVTQLCGGDEATMEFFEQNARIVITGVAYIADTRDAVIKELFKEAHNKEKEIDKSSSNVVGEVTDSSDPAPQDAVDDRPSVIIDENNNVYKLKPTPHKQVWPADF